MENTTFVMAGLKRGPMDDYFKYRVVPSFYIVLCFIGLFGNGLVIKVLWSILKRSTMRSVSDILVINLAFADFIFVGSLPFWSTELFLHEKWIFGTVGCKLLSFITLLNLYGSVFFLVAMGLDRYLAVVYVVRARNYRTPRNATIACVIVWSFASLIGLQALLFREIEHRSGFDRCSWMLPTGDQWIHMYFTLRVSFGFVLPFIVIVFCYVLIIVKLHRRARSSRLTGSHMTNTQQKITRAILAVISLFVVCWLPNHVITILHAINVKNFQDITFKQNLETANLVSACLAYANSSINPILYAFMKEEIRQGGTDIIINLFTCCKRRRRSVIGRRNAGKRRYGLTKLSFWRSTRQTVIVAIPENARDGIKEEQPGIEEKEKNTEGENCANGDAAANRSDSLRDKDEELCQAPSSPVANADKVMLMVVQE